MMEKLIIALVVGLAAGYLIRGYLKNKKTGGGCSCSSGACDINKSCSAYTTQEGASDGCPGMKTEKKTPISMYNKTPDS